ncbi:protein-tyrosine phosphatase family protein [Rickettsiales endosymbiont of Stachyamoeba lipophora]|uniref:protein-tyrosine phosphatase family protein n=1 Tax=Rickettsiales endosymbiont of Stachyamoeba lipophora TaxID=2486578 RepID=UPI000F6557D2|nr:protein-tyrosine phosphatase family protein [Rickettsiales endosymbiont of Stachyamoeba lipophora]AZL15977.1 hypothetical protein EF513_05430 [Rickettsiales endosymbiont of Stachyamoeba lipophora]
MSNTISTPIFDYTEYVIQYQNSKLYLEMLEHWKKNKNLKAYAVHQGSRIKNIIEHNGKNNEGRGRVNDGLDDKRELYGFERMNPETVIKLEAGTNKGKVLGANLCQFEAQDYVVCEAPYSIEEYYRMVLQTNSKILVSVAKPQTDDISYRKNFPVDLHYITKGEHTNFADTVITCIEEQILPLGKLKGKVKTLEVKQGNSKTEQIKHIIFEEWIDRGGSDVQSLYELVKFTQKSIEELNILDQSLRRICVNCKYGFGRSSTLAILMEVYKDIQEFYNLSSTPANSFAEKILQEKKELSLDLTKYIYKLSEDVMTGAGELHFKQVQEFYEYAKQQYHQIQK